MAHSSMLERLKISFAASAGDIVFGMEDGTVSIFGLVLGVAATTNDNKAILIAGASGAFAAAVSMMAGTYLEIETEADKALTFSKQLHSKIAQNPGAVIDRVTERLRAADMADEQTKLVTDLIRAEPNLLAGIATAVMAPSSPDTMQSPIVHALWMLCADFVSAAIPIIPFALMPVPQARWVSTAITMALLICLGVGRAWVGQKAVPRTVAETVSIGVAAALAGVGIGLVLSHTIGN